MWQYFLAEERKNNRQWCKMLCPFCKFEISTLVTSHLFVDANHCDSCQIYQ
jgi:hypothetical protein